jgi:hypothetical protein
MKALFSVLIFAMASSFHFADDTPSSKWQKFKEKLRWENIKKTAVENIAKLDIKLEQGLGETIPIVGKEGAEFASGLHAAVKYRYELEPSYVDNYYTRVDKWKLKTELNATQIFSGPDGALPVSLKLDSGAELMFVRQFKSQKKAAVALPCTLGKLPFTADNVINKLEPGDFVSFPVHMNLILSASIPFVQKIAAITGDTHILAGGNYQVHVFRMKDNRVRLKLFAQKKRESGVRIKSGFNLRYGSEDEEFNLFGIKLVDNAIKGFTKMNLAELSFSKETGTLFVLDYLFDLNNDKAKEAYDLIMQSYYTFKPLQAVSPFTNGKKMEDTILSVCSPAEVLFEADKSLPAPQRRVDRLFEGTNDYKRKKTKLRLDLKLFQFDNEVAYTENRITYTDRYDQRRQYYYPVYSVTRKNELLFGLTKEKSHYSSFALMLYDESQNTPTQFTEFGIWQENTDKRFGRNEQALLHDHLKRNLPFGLYYKINFNDWNQQEVKQNVRHSLQLILHRSAWNYLSSLSEEDYFRTLKNLLGSVPGPEYPRDEELFLNGNEPEYVKNAAKIIAQTDYRYLWVPAREMAERLHEIFSEQLDESSYQKKLKQLVKLRKNTVFSLLGTGYLIALFNSAEALKEHAFISLLLSAKDSTRVEFQYGNEAESALYLELQHIQSVLNDDKDYDLRLHTKDEVFREMGQTPDNQEIAVSAVRSTTSPDALLSAQSASSLSDSDSPRFYRRSEYSRQDFILNSISHLKALQTAISTEEKTAIINQLMEQCENYPDLNQSLQSMLLTLEQLDKGGITNTEADAKIKELSQSMINSPLEHTPETGSASISLMSTSESIALFQNTLSRYSNSEITAEEYKRLIFLCQESFHYHRDTSINSASIHQLMKILSYHCERYLVLQEFETSNLLDSSLFTSHLNQISELLKIAVSDSDVTEINWNSEEMKTLLDGHLQCFTTAASDPSTDKKASFTREIISVLADTQSLLNNRSEARFPMDSLEQQLLKWMLFTASLELRSIQNEPESAELLTVVYPLNRAFQTCWNHLRQNPSELENFAAEMNNICNQYKMKLLYPQRNFTAPVTAEDSVSTNDIILR